MNENLIRWIVASFNKHFADNDGSYNLLVEGDQITEELAETDHAELRLDHDFEEVAKNQYKVRIYVNILCVASIDNLNIHKIDLMVGKYLSTFTNAIEVKQYGTDPNESVGCATLDGKIIITKFAEKVNMQRVSIEGQYLLSF